MGAAVAKGNDMGIGVGIFLIAVGAILAFAVDAEANGVDISAVGFILIGAGVLGVLLDLIVFAPRRRDVAGPGGGGAVVEERRTYEEGPRY